MAEKIAVLDVGSSKAICIVVSMKEDGRSLVLHGSGECAFGSEGGYRPGTVGKEFPSEEKLKKVIRIAVEGAERKAHVKIDRLCVVVGAPFIRTERRIEKKIAVDGTPITITQETIESMQTLKERPSSENVWSREVLYYIIDDEKEYANPIGRTANKFEIVFKYSYIASQFKERVINAIHSELAAFRESDDAFIQFVLAPDVLAYAYVPVGEGQMGFVVDCGYTHTDIMFVENCGVESMMTVPLGGYDITNDLREQMGDLPFDVVENKIKREHVVGYDYSDSDEKEVICSQKRFFIRQLYVDRIVRKRICDIARYVGDFIYEPDRLKIWEQRYSEFDEQMPCPPIYLTGAGVLSMKGDSEECFIAGIDKQRLPNVSADIPEIIRKDDGGKMTYGNVTAAAAAWYCFTSNDLDLSKICIWSEGETKKRGLLSKLFKRKK